MNNNIPIYQITVDEDALDASGVNKISLVNDPAIEVDFVSFSKKPVYENHFLQADSKKYNVAGAFLIPDKKIYRSDERGEYYVVFTKEVIELIAKKFNKLKPNSSINIEHDKDFEQAYVAENWLIEDKEFDKSKKWGYDLPIGTWFGVVHIEDKKFWNENIETFKVKGFSVEGLMGMSLSKILNDIDEHIYNDEEKAFFLNLEGEKEEDLNDYDLVYTRQITEESIKNEIDFKSFEIESSPDEASYLDKGLIKIRYKYTGAYDNRNRNFCSQMMSKNLIYRKEDINQMSFRAENSEYGRYSIFLHKGSYGCRHSWEERIYFRKRKTNGQFMPNEGLENDKIIEKNKLSKMENNEVKLEKYLMKDGSEIELESLEVGTEVSLENGDYEMEDGKILVIEEGKIKEVKEVENTDDNADDNADAASEFNAEENFKAMAEMIANFETRLGDLEEKYNNELKAKEEELSKVKTQLSNQDGTDFQTVDNDNDNVKLSRKDKVNENLRNLTQYLNRKK